MHKGHNQKAPLLNNQGTFVPPQTNSTTSKWRKSTRNASSINPADSPPIINIKNYPEMRPIKGRNSKNHPLGNWRNSFWMQSQQTIQPENNHHEWDHLQTRGK